MQGFTVFDRKAELSMDFYRTDFKNQVVVDLENPQEVNFYNLDGDSYANSFQAEFSLNVSKSVDVRLAYKYLDVKSEFGGKIQQKVMVPNHRGFVNFGYKSRNKKWEYDITMSVFGESRLPVTLLEDSTLTTVNKSKKDSKRFLFLLGSRINLSYSSLVFTSLGTNLLIACKTVSDFLASEKLAS